MTREISLGTDARRMAVLGVLGAALGGVGGGAAFLLVRLIGLVSNLALLHRMGFALPNLAHYHPGPLLIPVALGGAACVVLLARWSPVIKGHGIPESLEAVVLRESRIRPRVLVAKPLSAALAMGTGGPFGAEGPIIVTGGCIGSLLGQWLRVTPAERRILLATGAAAGMAGVFSTPLAAVLVAFELLTFERSLRALVPLLLATGVAAEIHTLLIGPRPLFFVAHALTVSAVQLPMFLGLGLAAGALAVVLNKGLFAFEAAFRRLPVPPAVYPLIGAVAFACIGIAVPGSLSVGYWAISDSVNGRFLLGTAAVLLVGKLFSWWIALASNTSGGTLAPVFLVGATMGEILGIGFDRLFPAAHVEPASFAVVAMGATFGIASRALLTGAVFALEATGSYHLLVPMFLALAVGELCAEWFLDERLMTDKLVRRGLRVEFDTEVDPFRTAVARQAMDAIPDDLDVGAAPSVEGGAFLSEALPHLLDPESGHVVVTEDGVPVGVLSPTVVSEVLLRRIAESQPQRPTIAARLRLPSVSWAGAGRVLRLDETHGGTVAISEPTEAAATRADDGEPPE